MKLLETVEEYLRGIVTTQNIDRLFSGASKTHLSILAEGGLDAVQAMIRSIRSGSRYAVGGTVNSISSRSPVSLS